MKGVDGIRDLSLSVLKGLVDMTPPDPSLFFSNLLPSAPYESKRIEWEAEYGSTAMAPFVVPQANSPKIGLDGYARFYAEAAYAKQAIDFDWEFLINLRMPGTDRTKMGAQRELARAVRKLTNNMRRRKEWAVAKMITEGTLSYHDEKGLKFSINYGLPTDHVVTLGDAYKWGTGTLRNPVEDLDNAKTKLSEDAGIGSIPYIIMNSTTMKLLKYDEGIQGMLRKDAFGNGDLFAGNAAQVLADLLGVGRIIIYDEYYEVDATLTAAVAAGGGASYTVYVSDASDFEVGGTVRFQRLSGVKNDTETYYEDETISAVSVTNGTITVSTGPSIAFKVGDRVRMKKKFIADNKVVMFADRVGGEPIGEIMMAPYGFEQRYGLFIDRNVTWDPEVLTIRCQDSFLPVLYNPKAIYLLTVA